jgi:hypothetical protein
MAHGRKVGGKRERQPASSNDIDARAIRQWAATNGIEVNSRGRIPAEVVERYRSAGN